MAEVMTEKLEGLEALAAQIERAVNAITQLKAQNQKLAGRVEELEAKLGAGEKSLGGRKLDEVLAELDQLRGIEKQWTTERKEIAHRIDDLVKKLEKLEA